MTSSLRPPTCRECGTTLLRPARLCGFCTPGFDSAAALAALDREASESTTNWRRKRSFTSSGPVASHVADGAKTTNREVSR